jgi:NOL1/NOP2/sun family putative RNA methylase
MRGDGDMDLPSQFIKKMKELLQAEADDFFHTYDLSKKSGLRLNSLKLDNERWERLSPFELEKIPFVNAGYYYQPEKDQPGKHPFHAAGLYYIQEPSAMFVAQQLSPKPGDRVLDLCAAPGGKSTQLAEMMNQTGIIITNEINPKRAKALSENIERLGITNALVTNETPERLAQKFQGYFDKILVDAPCSGEGMFRKDEEAIQYWSQEHVLSCAKQQRLILDSAYEMLRQGGVIVYSTCTFSPEENEQTIEAFLNRHPDIEMETIPKPDGVLDGRPDWSIQQDERLIHTARLWPHKLQGEGHFVAKMKKTAPTEASGPPAAALNAGENLLKDFREFCNKALIRHAFHNLYLFNQQLYSLPDHCPQFQGLRILRAGLHLGELKKNRFEPNHALALSLNSDEAVHTFPLTSSDQEWFHYLKGETFTTEKDRGWILVTIDGFPLGWGKEAKGVLKNFYPKGLRIQN